MIPDAGFVFAVAGLNASFAGLGGLLLGLRRGPDFGPLDALRLRQVVEFAFANLLLAISLQPLVSLIGQDAALRFGGALSFAYVVTSLPVLQRRVARVGISWGRAWVSAAIVLSAIGTVLSAATVVAPTAGLFELLLVALLARPMVVFVLVLASLDEPDPTQKEGPATSFGRSSSSPSPAGRKWPMAASTGSSPLPSMVHVGAERAQPTRREAG